MRLHSPVPGVLRDVQSPIQVENVEIPARTTVMISFNSLHHNPAVWGEDHQEFKPERFLPENSDNRDSFAFCPFSAGPRFALYFIWRTPPQPPPPQSIRIKCNKPHIYYLRIVKFYFQFLLQELHRSEFCSERGKNGSGDTLTKVRGWIQAWVFLVGYYFRDWFIFPPFFLFFFPGSPFQWTRLIQLRSRSRRWRALDMESNSSLNPDNLHNSIVFDWLVWLIVEWLICFF